MAEAPRVILKMSVQLPDGRKGTIHVFPGSDPAELAQQVLRAPAKRKLAAYGAARR